MTDTFALAKYIVWVDFGTEGWKPYVWEQAAYALKYSTFGSQYIITRGPVAIPEPQEPEA